MNADESSAPDDLTLLYGPPLDHVRAKLSPKLNAWIRRFIELSPFVIVASSDAQGNCDASPRGGRPGFVRVLDDRTLLIPDAPGNRLFQTRRNLAHGGGVGLLFLVPGVPETARVNGASEVVDRHSTSWDRRIEHLVAGEDVIGALLVRVHEAYYHCGRAMRRGNLWDLATISSHRALPPLPKRPAPDGVKTGNHVPPPESCSFTE